MPNIMKAIIDHFRTIALFTLSIVLFSGAASMPPPAAGQERYGAVSFSIGTKGYLGTGIYYKQGTTYRKDFWEYNPSTDSWTQKANFSGVARGFAVGFSIGTKGYVGTGSTGGNTCKDFWEYNPATNAWTQKANYGGTDRECATGFSLGNKGYLGTGYKYVNGILQNLADFWEYDPATDTWVQLPDFPGGGRYAAAGFGIGTKGYVGTGLNKVGDDNFLWFRDFYEYDQSTGSWTQKSDFGGSERGFTASFNIGGKGYLGTGNSVSGLFKDFWEYDPASDTWLQKTDLGGIPRSCSTGFSIGTKGYLGTGLKAQYQYLTDFWEYTPATNAWTQKTDLGKKHKGPLKESDAIPGMNPPEEMVLIVYPNPSSSTFSFRLQTASQELLTIQLYDISGRLISQYQGLSPAETISIGEALMPGIYIAVVTQGMFRKSVRIAKVN
jgi:N-acetylneuraminic acid mutarotase